MRLGRTTLNVFEVMCLSLKDSSLDFSFLIAYLNYFIKLATTRKL